MDDRLAARALALGSLLGLCFGAVFLVVPGWIIGLFGYVVSPAGELLARLFGAQAIGFSLVGVWLGRYRRIRTALVRSHLAAEGLAGVLPVVAVSGSGGNALAWAIPAVFLAFAAVWTYLLVSLPRS